jgi:glutathione-independent formaldehyde dehydrogenase
MATNRGLAYMGKGKVEVQSIPYPKLALGKRKCEHGVILKIVATNICGSDQHMVRGRTTAPEGLILGHEMIWSRSHSTLPAGAAATARKAGRASA